MKAEYLAVKIAVREDAPDFVLPNLKSSMREVLTEVIAQMNLPGFADLVELSVMEDGMVIFDDTK